MARITFSWDQQLLREELEGKMLLRIVRGQDVIDIIQSTDTFTLDLAEGFSSAAFLICSPDGWSPFGHPVPDRVPLVHSPL